MTIYVIQSDEPPRFKIGYTIGNPQARLRNLQTGSAGPLRLRAVWWGASRKAEAELHQRFAEFRRGGEWFEQAPDIGGWIRSLPASGALTFWTWVQAQEGREDPIGDLAEDVTRSYRLFDHPNRACANRFGRPPIESSEFDVWLRYLERRMACIEAKRALIEGFEEWEGACTIAP